MNAMDLGSFYTAMKQKGLSDAEINAQLSGMNLSGRESTQYDTQIPEGYMPAAGKGLVRNNRTGNMSAIDSGNGLTLSDLLTQHGASASSTVDFMGKKGYMTADGNVVGLNPDGSAWKATTGVDRAAQQAAEDRALKMAQANAAIEHTKAQTEQMRQKPAMPAPPGYRWTSTGNLEAIPGGPADVKEDKPLTDAQGNAMLFGSRAADAHNILNELQGKYSQAGLSAKQTLENIPLFGNNLVSGIGNAILSPEQKQAQQAQINFLTAILRKESGASIAPSEFDSAAKVYFPSATDDATTIENKKRAREEAVQGLKLMAGPGAKKIDAVMEKIKSQQPVSAASSQVFSVTDPNGVVHKFPSAAAADAFKKAAGL